MGQVSWKVAVLGILALMATAAPIPARAEIAIFQQGVNGYQGGQDTSIRAAIEIDRFLIDPNDPNSPLGGDTGAYDHWVTNGGSSTVLEVGHFFQNLIGFIGRPGPTYRYGKMFLRFGDVIGTAPGQVPPDATIDSATLTLHHQEDLGSIVASSGISDNPPTTKAPTLNRGNIRVSPLLQPVEFGTSDGWATPGEVTSRLRRYSFQKTDDERVNWAQGCKGGDYPFDPNGPDDGLIYELDNDPFGIINFCGPADGIDHDESRAVDYFQDEIAGKIDVDVTSITLDLTGDGVLLNVVHDPNNPMLPGMFGPNWGAAYRSNEYANADDRPQLTIEFTPGGATPGDASGDGVVDVADLGIVGANFGQSGATFADGDFNGDGTVDVADLGILGANWSAAGSAAELDILVPEPAVFGAILLGLPLLTRRRRNH